MEKNNKNNKENKDITKEIESGDKKSNIFFQFRK